ncbi:MAG: 16S rRNA (cytidine(1402)-2'-O)-methyltransferase [Nitrosospira sp.]|nr:16S rRNA (cytidine(1402)-2'-O)-methyltransferase [Nitrosospira sp.]
MKDIIAAGTLYVVATPIGNLRDITLRALDILAGVDIIAAEDTRTTRHLLTHYAIAKNLMAVHRHNESMAAHKIASLLSGGKAVALVADAGTPGISDPGGILVKTVREQGHPVVPVPGANAAICALSASGITTPHFLFYGFLPASAGSRRRELAELKQYPCTLVFYEAPHRILECVSDLAEVLGVHRQLTIARELTKLFESVHICALGEAIDWFQADPDHRKGEFVLLLSGAETRDEGKLSDQTQSVLKLLLQHLPLKQAVKVAAEISGQSKNMLYSLALSLKDGTEDEIRPNSKS